MSEPTFYGEPGVGKSYAEFDEFAIPDDPGPDASSIVVAVVMEEPIEDIERALPEDIELHVIEDAAVRFENHAAWIMTAITATTYSDYGSLEVDVVYELNEKMPPSATRHLLAYMHDLGLVTRRGVRGKGIYWKRVQ